MDIRTEGKGKKAVFNQYKVKVYDKGVQFGCGDDILRYEIGYFKMQSIGRVLLLSDLIDITVWNDLAERLVQSLGNVLFTDVFNDADLTEPERKLFTFCNNPDEWEQADKKKRNRARPRLDTLIATKGKYKFGYFFTDILRQRIGSMTAKSGYFFTDTQKTEKGLFYHLSIGENSTLASFEQLREKYRFYFDNNRERFCAVTRLPLVYFDRRSKNMNPKTLMYLQEHCFEIYEILKSEFMSVFNGYTSKEPDEYTYIAKQIRNTLSNPKIYRERARRFLGVEQLALF